MSKSTISAMDQVLKVEIEEDEDVAEIRNTMLPLIKQELPLELDDYQPETLEEESPRNNRPLKCVLCGKVSSFTPDSIITASVSF